MSRMRSSGWPLIAPMAALVVVLLGAVAYAQAETGLEGKVRSGQTVVVAADETVPHDLYVSGGTVRVEGSVEGDLVAAGGQVDVTGTVTGDALLAGGRVTVSGDVEGDVRVGTGDLSVTGSVGEDLLIAAGQATVGSAAVIGEDLIFSAGRMVMGGQVDGSAFGGAGDYRETGSIAGSREVTVAPEEAPPTAGDRVLGALARYVSLLLVGALLLWLTPGLMRGGAQTLRREPLLSLGVGTAGFLGAVVGGVLTVVVAILLAVLLGVLQLGGLAGVSLVGALLFVAVLAYALVVVTAFVAHVLVGLWLGQYLLPGDRGWLRTFGALAVGVLAVVVLGSLPILGGIVRLLVVLLGLGALLLMAFRRLRRPAAPQAPAQPPAVTPP